MAAHVRQVLEEAGLTQVKIAQAIGVEQTAVSKRYRGTTSWRAVELRIISSTFGIPIERFYDGQPTPTVAAS
jgi:transcriptional regulator with XRE-family HTH domain